ncbi:DUF7677 family protein [Sphingomonas psychrotolerans]|uniref:DUF7677 domain-containing protein n=1 Tax=Sphingomonas psychrotolerans TaxID=1327635 RepID=A0A2K8MGT3_9SPHN|nr:hypothetical protein [Sphingomonas psychrotolerans]ATY30949.1 hypothetical protein CVN68_02230 [Sphingomonas psychrotolerans]
MSKVSHEFSGALRTFAFWVANRTVGLPLLEGIDYSCIFEEPSALEATFAIYANVMEMDDDGKVLNAKWAEHRAAQYILMYVTGQKPEPPFEEWEDALHEPPNKRDVLPWPTDG